MKVNLRRLLLLMFVVFCVQANAQNNVTGIVKNEKQETLLGVSVKAILATSGKASYATTNEKGVFNFSNLTVGGPYSFVFTSVGFAADTLSNYFLEANSNITLSVVLKDDTKQLNDVVVIGYGTARKQDLSAAVATVPNMAQVKDRPVQDIANMIQGQVPGVTVVANGGHPGSTPNITIRGIGSRGGENVLYVVDGVPNAPYNPADVVSITVLKDAASAAIYGAFSGSAGVILITTRQSSKGNPSIQYDGFTGVKSAWRLPQSLSAADEAKVANLAYTNAGLTPLDGWDATKNPDAQVTRTDWIGSIFRTSVTQRHTLTLNAGTDKFSTLIQGRYEDNEGTLINTFNKNLSLRFNANYKFNDHISFRQEIFWNNNNNRDAETSSGYSGVVLSAIYMPRSATVYYNDGTFGGVGPRNSDYLGIHGDAINPVATLLRNQPYNKTNNALSVSEFKVTSIVPGLNFLSRFSYNQSQLLYKSFSPKRTEPGKPNDQNSLSYSTDKSYNWLWENTINYDKRIKQHSISAMVSMTAQEARQRGFSASARGFENEDNWAQFFVNASIFDQDRPSDYDNEDRNLSYVGRLSYSWADRYFVTGSYRYDMAGRLAIGYRGNGFPAVTGAWKLSSEPFFNVKNVDLVKFRASWGRIGNLGSIGYYYGYPSLTQNGNYQIGDGSPLSTGLYLNSAFNPSLSWETSEQTDIGVDLAFLNNRLTISGDYFDKLTFNLIQQQTLGWPNTNGISAPYLNQGKIKNTGFEFTGDWHDRIGNVGYGINGNIATLKNRVVYIDGAENSFWQHGDAWRGVLLPYRSTVGQPYYSYWLVKTDGIFQSDAEAQGYAKDGTPIQPQAKAGDLKFVDANGDGKIDDNDRVYMGSGFPKFTYAFSANANWKGFDIAVFFQGVSGVKLFNAFKESTLNASEQGYNRWDKILDAWSPTNTGSNIPKISASDANKNFNTPSDWYLENGDYLRLKNLTIGYTFKMPFKTSSLRVYLSGDNLLTFTKYSGMDPEVGGIGLDGGQYPVSRVYSIGASLKF